MPDVYTPAKEAARVSERIRRIIYAMTGPLPFRGSRMTEITTMEQLDDVIAGTERRPVFLYKHSTICPTSFGSKRRVTEYIAKAAESATPAPEFYLVNVIESRPISNAIAERFNVPHKSPQLLLIDRGRCTWNKSHYEIDAKNIDHALQDQTA